METKHEYKTSSNIKNIVIIYYLMTLYSFTVRFYGLFNSNLSTKKEHLLHLS